MRLALPRPCCLLAVFALVIGVTCHAARAQHIDPLFVRFEFRGAAFDTNVGQRLRQRHDAVALQLCQRFGSVFPFRRFAPGSPDQFPRIDFWVEETGLGMTTVWTLHAELALQPLQPQRAWKPVRLNEPGDLAVQRRLQKREQTDAEIGLQFARQIALTSLLAEMEECLKQFPICRGLSKPQAQPDAPPPQFLAVLPFRREQLTFQSHVLLKGLLNGRAVRLYSSVAGVDQFPATPPYEAVALDHHCWQDATGDSSFAAHRNEYGQLVIEEIYLVYRAPAGAGAAQPVVPLPCQKNP